MILRKKTKLLAGFKVNYFIFSAWIFLFLNLFHTTTYAMPSLQDISYIVITHENTPVKKISINRLRTIYGLKTKYWDDQTPIIVYTTNPLEKEYRIFSKQVLGMFSHQLQRAWNRLIYSGRALPPTTVMSFKEMMEAVSTTPGAIGYIPKRELNATIQQLEIRGISNED